MTYYYLSKVSARVTFDNLPNFVLQLVNQTHRGGKISLRQT